MQPNPERVPVATSSRRQRGLLVVYRHDATESLDAVLDDDELWRRLGEDAVEWTVLTFEDRAWADRFRDACARRGVAIAEVLLAHERIDDAAVVARERYHDFVADWPGQPIDGGRSFKQRFTHRGEISYWWLASGSFKSNETSLTFGYLCHLEVLRAVLAEGAWKRCVMAGDDTRMTLLAGRACVQAGVGFSATGGSGGVLTVGLLRGLAGRAKFLAWLAVGLVVGRLALPGSRRPQARNVVGFFTVHPAALQLGPGGPREANYVNMPDAVADADDADALLLAVHSPGMPWEWLRLAGLRRSVLRRQGPRVVFLDRLMRPSDLALGLAGLWFAVRYWWLQRTSRSFRASFRYDGLDIRELAGEDMSRAFLSNEVTHNLYVARLVERAVRAYGIGTFVCFLELYPEARAAYYGAKRADPSVRTVAYQHADINRMRLWYSFRPRELSDPSAPRGSFIERMPVPDVYLFQGGNGRAILIESGYPAERCLLTGSPRYDALSDLVHAAPDAWPPAGDVATVLVLPSLSWTDSTDLVAACARACDGGPFAMRVKAHPDTPIGPIIADAARSHPTLDLREVDGDVRQHILAADVVVISYSTTGDEAVALGKPVVCYAGLAPCQSTFLDVPAAPIVRGDAELTAAIRSAAWDRERWQTYREHAGELVQASFHTLDGHAIDRVTQALLAPAEGAAS